MKTPTIDTEAIFKEMRRIEQAAVEALDAAYDVRKEPIRSQWCVNWGDYGVADVRYERSLNGGNGFTVYVEEASPDNEDLGNFLMAWMEQHGVEEPPIFVFNW